MDVRDGTAGSGPRCAAPPTRRSGHPVIGIGGHLEHGLGGRPQQQVVDDPGIRQCDRVEDIRQREDEVEVRHGEQLRGPRLQPPCRGRGLAGGAVAVAAGVVGDLLMPALGAPQDMTAQSRGAAGGQVLEGAALLGRQPWAVLLPGTRRGQLRMTPATVGRGWVMTGDLLAGSGRGDRTGFGSSPARRWPRGRTAPWC